MSRWRFASIAMLGVAMACSLTVAEEAKVEFKPPTINVPDGYTVELAAAPPLVKHPIMAGFDERGRLFVAANAGENLKRADLEERLPNFVQMLEDTDGDGRFDKSTVFADKLTFPQGALWHDGALYVASSGAIWRFEDTNDDGVADDRRKLVSDFGYTGNAADVHGPFLGPEGRIYWCEGRHGHEITDADGRIISQGKAARIFSCRADGGDVRIHCGGGMDNPVEIDFTREGEMLGTVNIMYRQRGDCLVHWLHGGVYPRHDQQQVVDEFKRTGDLLTEAINLGHVAVSGTTRYRGTHLGAEFQDSFFICEFNTRKVIRVSLTRDGSTFRGQRHEFLEAASSDFHPTDVLEDADGSLLVVDTGGWFRIGCPTSQIAKPNILGAIYRIRKTDKSTVEDPRGLQIAWNETTDEQLADLLDDDRFAVRQRAIETLSKRGVKAIGALDEALSRHAPENIEARRNAVWSLARIDVPESQELLRRALQDPDDSVRHAVVFSFGERGDKQACEQLAGRLTDSNPTISRAIATALGKRRSTGSANSVGALLARLKKDDVDRALEHALIYALIEIDDPRETALGLNDPDPRVRRGALIALDQMDSGDLTRESVTSLLDSDDFALRQTTLEIISRNPDWADGTVPVLGDLIREQKLDDAAQAVLRGSVIAFCQNGQIQQLVADSLADEATPLASRLLLLDAMARCGLDELPASWREQLLNRLPCENADELRQVIATVDLLDDKRFAEHLLRVSHDYDNTPADVRLAALGVAVKLGAPVSKDSLRRLVAAIHPDVPPMRRLTAARAIGAAKLDDTDLAFVARAVQHAGPLELGSLLDAFEHSSDARVGRQLILSLTQSPGFESLTAEHLNRVLSRYFEDVQAQAAPLFERLAAASAEQVARLAQLEEDVTGGDPQRGQEVYRSKRTSCVGCHRVDGSGGIVGPDLSDVGQRRSKRDLLEAILYPSSSLVRGFESYAIATESGKIHTGLILRETADSVYLRTTDQAEVRLRRAEISEMLPRRLSIMPTGFDKTISDEQLRDLIAYLQSLKELKERQED